MKKKVYSSNNSPVKDLEFLGLDLEKAENIDDADILYLPGGSDVSPKMYGEKRVNVKTISDEYRDVKEFQLVTRALKRKIPIIGICRGAQFLTVMAGGSLVQNVDNHDKLHEIELYNGDVFPVTSSHHQMMYPYPINDKTKYEVLAWSKEKYSTKYEIIKDVELELDQEPEIVFYKDLNAIAIQCHPEYYYQPKGSNEKIAEIVFKTVLKDENILVS